MGRKASCDLRGASADFAKGHLGSKVERVVRQSVKPVLVASRAFKQPDRAVIAFDGGPSARKAVDYAAAAPLFADVALCVVLAGREGRESAEAAAWARECLSGRDAELVVREGKPEDVIAAEIAAAGSDMLIMAPTGTAPCARCLSAARRRI